LGFVTGCVYFLGIMNWLMILVPFSTVYWVGLGYIVLSVYLACYVFIFSVSVNLVTSYWRRHYPEDSVFQKIAYILFVAIAWTGTEVLRGYVISGLPWASLGYTQWKILPVIQIASFAGMYAVTFLIALINGMIAVFVIDISKWKSSLKSAVVPLGILAVCLIYGWVSMSNTTDVKKIKVGMVPGNIKQRDKMNSWGDKAGWIFDKYLQATQIAEEAKPDLLVWPETAVPQFIFPKSAELNQLTFLLSRWNVYMLMGAISYEQTDNDWKVFNSAFMLTPEGKVIDKYDKIHLVPVSESFPFKSFLPKKWQAYVTGTSDFDSGSRYTVFSSPLANIGVPICFESVFPQISRKFVQDGANLIGIITNDSWFVGTFAAQQHFSMAPFRAVENRVSVFRCANYGVSCIIDPYGRVTQKLEPDKGEDYLLGDVGIYPAGTFYTRHGDYFPWTCLAVLLFFIVQQWWYNYVKFVSIRGGLYARRDTLRNAGSKKQGHGGRRSSLTPKTKKKK